MSYCTQCGQAMDEKAAFCSCCGAPVEAPLPVPVAGASSAENLDAQEQEFLDTTHRLLRWERKAWSICSKVYIISGAIFMGLFALIFLIGIASTEGDAFANALLATLGFVYTFVLGGSFLAIGIVNKKACDKIPQYLDTVYTDFSLTDKRCGSVGMLVFSVLFGAISPIFFIINFARMKANRETIQRIIQKQHQQ